MVNLRTRKRLNLFHDRQVNLSVNVSPVNTTTCYKYLSVHLDRTLNLNTHFHKIYKKAAGRVNPLRRIPSSIDTFIAQQIHQLAIISNLRIAAIITPDGLSPANA